ncbi:hypothetical protein QBC41DRAFT_298927 [Cercophora samala]|uniref:2EXR domain-containing protein n=1 Tax=Cercophora samala TaxID=330535 RepID=A0AA39ZL64_9PEZI|nr:hypothetical protein QBC41DRAFT_298927 [Cercophora samala]
MWTRNHGPGDWGYLPAEIRLHIIREVCTPRTVVVRCHRTDSPDARKRLWEEPLLVLGGGESNGEPPVTLYLNMESRTETLKDYHQYCFELSSHQGCNRRRHYGWINPKIDIMHIPHPDVVYMPSLRFRNLNQPLLQITLGCAEFKDQARAEHYMDLQSAFVRAFETCYNLVWLIKTIDFCVGDHAQPKDTWPRYRLCRTTPAQEFILISCEEAIFCPQAQPDERCGFCDTTVDLLWQWQYDPQSSYHIWSELTDMRLMSTDPDIDIDVDESIGSASNDGTKYIPPNPNELAKLRAHACVSHYFVRDGARVLSHEGALVFKNSDPDAPMTPGGNGEHWSLLRVLQGDEDCHRFIAEMGFFSHQEWHGDPETATRTRGGSFDVAATTASSPAYQIHLSMEGSHRTCETILSCVSGVCVADFEFPQERERHQNDDPALNRYVQFEYTGAEKQFEDITGSTWHTGCPFSGEDEDEEDSMEVD